jgi:hypothetical protein
MRVSDKKTALTRGQLRAMVAGRSDKEIASALRRMMQKGQKKADLDLNLIVTMRLAGCTEAECAAELGVSSKTIQRRLKEDPLFKAMYDGGEERGKSMIRRKQFVKAVSEGDTAMCIWLGKQRLGQVDRPVITVKTDRLDEVIAAVAGGDDDEEPAAQAPGIKLEAQ